MPTPMLLETGDGYWLWPNGDIILWGDDLTMSYDLFDLTYRVAREMGIVFESTATGGSATTIADSVMLTQADDYWNNGVAWIIRDSAGASAAPEGEYSIISDFDATTDTITLVSTLTADVAAGDRFAVCRKMGNFSWLNILIQKVNQALQELGVIPYTDVTSVVIEDDKTEYSLPIAAKQDLRQVWLQMDNTDANDNLWRRVYNWRIEHEDPGTADTLILPYQYTSGYYLKLVYMAPHPALYTPTAVLSEHVPVERIIYPAVRDCFKHLRDWTRTSEYDDKIQEWTDKAERVKLEKPIINAPKRQHRVGDLGNTESANREDEPNKVYLEW